jgi:hypothetical protein
VQALAGDSVDNVPGAPGIGVKTAALLINEYGDLETLLARAGEIKQPKRRQTLIDNAEQIRISRKLVELTPTRRSTFDARRPRHPQARARGAAGLPGADGVPHPDAPRGREAGRGAAGDRRDAAARRRPAPQDEVPRAPAPSTTPPMSASATWPRCDWIARIREQGYFAFDTETTSLDEMRADLVGISLALAPNEAAYLPLGHRDGRATSSVRARWPRGRSGSTRRPAGPAPVFEDDAILKIGQNVKYDAKVLARHGISVAPFDDTMLMSYALHAGLHNHGMDTLSEQYLGHIPIPIKDLIGSGKAMKTFDRCPSPTPPATPPRMPTSPCASGRPSARACTARASPRSTRRWSARWSRSWRRWSARACWSTARRSRACRTPSPRRWRSSRTRSTTWRASGSTSAPPSSWARSCSTRWACRAATRARPAPGRPPPTCSRIWRPSMTCPPACSTGGRSPS